MNKRIIHQRGVRARESVIRATRHLDSGAYSKALTAARRAEAEASEFLLSVERYIAEHTEAPR